MTNDKYKNYFYDLGMLIKEKAIEAKTDKDLAIDTNDYDYKVGFLMAYNEIVSIMKQQADTFGIDQKDLSLNDICPEMELL